MAEPYLDKHIEAVRRELRVRAWGMPQVERAWHALSLRRDQELRLKRVAAVALAIAASVALVFVGFRSLSTEPAEATGGGGPERMAVADGIDARVDPATELGVRERTPERVVVTVGRGKANFRVRHDPKRVFRVEARGVTIEDLGTAFEVAVEAESVRVFVSEGVVSVSFVPAGGGARQTATLKAGERGTYPAGTLRSPPEAAAGSPANVPAAPQPSADARGALDAAASADWRALARAGKHRRAYEVLAPGGFRDVRNDPQDLLLASDVARLSQHPAESAMLLRRLLSAHGRDARAPSAAFTLGWVLMNELGRPREAAQAFARAEALSPRGNLAEDAVARTVEAWYRAGELSRAKAEVERYTATYPNGRHTSMLQRLVGTP